MIQLKSRREIEVMARGGAILADTVAYLHEQARAGMSTMDLDRAAEEFIRSHEGATPSFKGLYGFPGSICASINNEIVHGIPSKRRMLRDGDLVSIDVGVRYGGFHTDSATTVPIGTVDETSRRLLEITVRALDAGIAAARAGNHIGDIGAAVQAVVERAGFSVVRDLVGHGIGTEFHEDPQVPNYGKPKRGTKLVEGLTIAIEPMVNAGSPRTRTMPDKWTIVTADGSRSAHFEHTVVITGDGPRVLTRRAA
ncbi:MAG TPA: type I methionyl aminopeptidase [Gemmatimonadaceae bacterium]|nr:type I methionyl aminopeptidase [Gemmatimonadaceae bacterium]